MITDLPHSTPPANLSVFTEPTRQNANRRSPSLRSSDTSPISGHRAGSPARPYRGTRCNDPPAASTQTHSTLRRHPVPTTFPLQLFSSCTSPYVPSRLPGVFHTEGTRQLSHREDQAAPSLCLALPGPVPPSARTTDLRSPLLRGGR